MPPTPPPTTIAVFSTGGTLFGMRSSSRDAFATAILTASFALAVASSGWCMCTHEFWSRMFAISNRKGFRPPAAVALRNVGSCRRGRTGRDDDAGQVLLLDSICDLVLPGGSSTYTRSCQRRRRSGLSWRIPLLLDVNGTRDIGTTVAQKNTNPCLFILDFCHVFAPHRIFFRNGSTSTA